MFTMGSMPHVRAPLALLLLLLPTACLDDEPGTKDDLACARIVSEYEGMYGERYGDHAHRDFDRILAAAKPYLDDGDPSCRTLQGIRDSILRDRGQTPRKDPLGSLGAGQIVLFGLGVLLMLVSMGTNVWIMVLAFQESVAWGLGCLFVPFVSLIFVIQYWQESKRPFLIGLATSVLGVLCFAATAA